MADQETPPEQHSALHPTFACAAPSCRKFIDNPMRCVKVNAAGERIRFGLLDTRGLRNGMIAHFILSSASVLSTAIGR